MNQLPDIPIDQLHNHPANANVMSDELFAKLVAHLSQADRYPPIIVRPRSRPRKARNRPRLGLGIDPNRSATSPPSQDRQKTATSYNMDHTSVLAPADERCPNPSGGPGLWVPPPRDRDGSLTAGATFSANEAQTPAHCQSVQGFEILDGHHRVAALRKLGRDTARCVVWDVDDDEALLLLATLNRLAGDDDPRKRAALVGRLNQKIDTEKLAKLLPESADRLQSLLALNRPPPQPRPPRALADMPVAVHFFLSPQQRSRLEKRLRQIGGPREAALMQLVDPS